MLQAADTSPGPGSDIVRAQTNYIDAFEGTAGVVSISGREHGDFIAKGGEFTGK